MIEWVADCLLTLSMRLEMTTESDNATALWHFVDTARYMGEYK